MALAVLAKGPVGFVLPTAIIVLSLWIHRCVSLHAGSDGTQVDLRLQLTSPLSITSSIPEAVISKRKRSSIPLVCMPAKYPKWLAAQHTTLNLFAAITTS